MVAPNRRSVDEILAYAKKVHLELVEWAESDAERTIVLGTMQQLDTQYRTVMFIKEEKDRGD